MTKADRAADLAQAAQDDGYDGPAELIDNGQVISVHASLAGHFEPISGSYRWYGRLSDAADESESAASTDARAALAALASTARTVVLRTPQGQAETRLSDVDPWHRPRVEGFGVAPFTILADVAGS